MRVDPAGGVIGVEQIDHVRADVQDAPPDPTELRIETYSKRITTGEITTDPNTGDEQSTSVSRSRVSTANAYRAAS